MQEIGEKVLSVRFFLLLFLKFLVIKQSFALALNFITSVTRIRLHGTLLHIGRINYIFAMENGEVYALTSTITLCKDIVVEIWTVVAEIQQSRRINEIGYEFGFGPDY